MVFWVRSAPCVTTVINELTSGSCTCWQSAADRREHAYRSKCPREHANSFSGRLRSALPTRLEHRRPLLRRHVSDSFKTGGPGAPNLAA